MDKLDTNDMVTDVDIACGAIRSSVDVLKRQNLKLLAMLDDDPHRQAAEWKRRYDEAVAAVPEEFHEGDPDTEEADDDWLKCSIENMASRIEALTPTPENTMELDTLKTRSNRLRLVGNIVGLCDTAKAHDITDAVRMKMEELKKVNRWFEDANNKLRNAYAERDYIMADRDKLEKERDNLRDIVAKYRNSMRIIEEEAARNWS